MALYPPDRVRELHVSGGSWQPSISEPGRQIRRDTHDDAVPDEVFTWLETAIDQCSNLRYVVLEQLGTALTTETERAQFRADFDRMDTIIQQKNKVNRSMSYSTFMPKVPLIMNRLPLENGPLHNQQLDLSAILETATDHRQAQARLADSSLANSAWKVETWQPSMLEAAIAIAKKWKNGF